MNQTLTFNTSNKNVNENYALAKLVDARLITRKTASLILKAWFYEPDCAGKIASQIAQERNWWIVDDFETICNIVYKILVENPNLVDRYRERPQIRNALMGKVYGLPDSHVLNMDIVNNVMDWMLDYDGMKYWKNPDSLNYEDYQDHGSDKGRIHS